MADAAILRRAFERNAEAVSLRPSVGRGTARTTTRWEAGAPCEIREGEWTLVADLSEASGGSGEDPNPGVLGRAALGSCLALGYAQQAAVEGVPIDAVQVEVEADYDAAPQYGLGDCPPGWSSLRYRVKVESPADEGQVRELADRVDRLSPLLDVFRRAVPLKRDLVLDAPREPR